MQIPGPSADEPRSWHATTILTIRKDGRVVIAGDGQVSLGATIIKATARKVRTLGKGYAQWLLMFVPDCPERDKAIDAIDLATMHANAAIARTQLKGAWYVGKLPEPPEQPSV